MRQIIFSVIGLVALVAAADPVVKRTEDITVSLDSVTVPLEAITVSPIDLASVTRDKPATRQELVAAVRSGEQDKRLKAFEQVWDQDDVFFLFFKPGEDKNVAVRVSAVERIAEVDVIKRIAKSVKILEVAEAANKRLEGVYLEKADQQADPVSPVVGSYAHRMRSRL